MTDWVSVEPVCALTLDAVISDTLTSSLDSV